MKTNRERLSFLTRAAPLVQEKDVFAKLGDNVSFGGGLTMEGLMPVCFLHSITNSSLCFDFLLLHIERQLHQQGTKGKGYDNNRPKGCCD